MKRVLSLFLALIMAIGVMPVTALAAFDYAHNGTQSTDEYYNLISKTDWENAPGINESEIILNNDAGDYRQVVHIMKADVNNEFVNVIPTYTEMNTSKYQTGTMLDQANWIDQNMEGEVIGVMNCCLSWYTGYPADRFGEPLGFMMLNGEIMFDPANCGYNYGNVGFPTCVVINKDVDENGNPRPADIPKVEMPQIRSSNDLDGWEETVIPVSSGYIVKDGANQAKAAHKNDGAPRSVVGITADGEVVMMLNDGRQDPFSAGMNMYECAEVMLSAGCVFAANCDGGGSSTFVSQRPGEELKVNNSPSDGGLRPSTSGICFISTAPADGKFAKAAISTSNVYYTPNSEIQFEAIGTDLVGNPAEIPEDASWQLVETNMGTISETGVFTSNGTVGSVTAQMVYEGEVVGEATVTIVVPEIAFRNETIVIGYGDTMNLPVEVTTNEGRNTVTHKNGDIVYTLSDENLGTIVGDQFTACDESTGLTGGTITAVICGQEDKKVTAEIRFGKASEIAYDFEDGQFPIDTSKTGNIGGDDAEDNGEYIYGWHINDIRANGHFSYRNYTKKNYTPVGMDIPAKVYLVNKDNGLVRNGNYAMGVDIDWTNVTASCHGQMDIHLPEPLDLTDATSVGFWLYIPAEIETSTMDVRVEFAKTEGGATRVDGKLAEFLKTYEDIKNGGWYYFSWDVLDNYKALNHIQINSHYTAGEGNYNYYQDVTYYIDDITVDYSDATIDRENPYFTGMTIVDEYSDGVEVSGQTINTNTVNLMAQAYENTGKANATGLDRNSVKVYVDGVLSDKDAAVSAGGAISVDGLYLNDGVHTIVMEISDNQGNVGSIVRKLTVNTDKSDVRLEVPASDGLIPTGSIYWVNLVADNLESVESVTTTINLDYVNDWELEGMEVASGFEAEYYINEHNDAVLTFTRTEEKVADTTVLAKLPIRIWMAKGWMDDSGIRKDYISDDPKMQDKYYILTPHAMWYSDGTRDYRLVVGAEAGVVTYTDGTTASFSANETVIQTEMNRYFSNADRQNKWSFHICTPGTAQSKAATCTEAGYENRVFCVGCACGTVENLEHECDTHNGCGSVVEWGTFVPATGHKYEVKDGKLVCECGETITGSGLVETQDAKYYLVEGNVSSGWIFADAQYYFDPVTFKAATGERVIDNHNYLFNEEGALVRGSLEYNGSNYVYYWAGKFAFATWEVIDGNKYYFDAKGHAATGFYTITGFGNTPVSYLFTNEGVLVEENGIYVAEDGNIYYLQEGVALYAGLVQDAEGNYYYINSSKKAVKNTTYGISEAKTNGLLPAGVYKFGADGKMIDPPTVEPEDPVDPPVDPEDPVDPPVDPEDPVTKEGLVVDADGEIRYYVDGEAVYAGLVQDEEGNYYYINSSKKAVKDVTYGISEARTNGLLPAGAYKFGADGKMIDPPTVEPEDPVDPPVDPEDPVDPPVDPDPEEPVTKEGIVVDEDGKIRYYVDGVATYAGLVQDAEGNYYYINSSKTAVTNCKYGVSAARTNGLLPEGLYEFGADGKMIDPPTVEPEDPVDPPVDPEDPVDPPVDPEDPVDPPVDPDPEEPATKEGIVVDEDGEIRYYVDGKPVYAGLVQDAEGNYYYINSAKKAVKNCKYGISAAKTNGLLPAGLYEFGADGKMIR
ncbi:MAG: phosphodiester glycosidase family protein [Oscillospiraceae bacterium]|nr:phosphodiester glycosidase family protein [Oscillospiraceae bacterium]